MRKILLYRPQLKPHTLFVYMGVLVSNFCQELAVGKARHYLFLSVLGAVH